MQNDKILDNRVLAKFLKDRFGIAASLKELVGYQDKNYLVTSEDGDKYVLKVTMNPEDLEFIKSQSRVLKSLSDKATGRLLPRPVLTNDGELISDIQLDGKLCYARLFPFIEGEFLAETEPELEFYHELGEVFGQIDLDMIGLEDAVLKCRTHEWDLSRVPELAEDVHLIQDPAVRRLVHYFMMKYREEVQPVAYKLPKGLIHGDGNDWNVVVGRGPRFRGDDREDVGGRERGPGIRRDDREDVGGRERGPGIRRDDREDVGGRERGPGIRGDDREDVGGKEGVRGVIDFGDMVWGARVNEVAIVLAYAMMGKENYREIFQEVVQGYNLVIPLTDIELSILYYVVAARWCQTMVMAARQERLNPGSSYHQVSVDGARKMLHRWIRQNPVEMEGGVKKVKNDKNVKNDKSVKNGKIEEEEAGEKPLVAELRYNYFSRAVSLSYKEPIHMIGAAMQYMYSADGRTYLDCVNNIPHTGHCHPRVVEAGQKQMARLNTNTRYLYNSLDCFAEKLLSKFPASLNKVFFVNSGSAATDLAVRLAEAYTGNCEYLVLDYAYHGNTKAAIGLSPYKFNRKGGKGKPENVRILPTSPGSQPPPGPLLMREGEERLRTFFAESIVGCAGQIMLSKEFMQQTVNEVRASGGIYVADEVQTGFGRVGHKFWAYELYDVVPDIVILGKPMGNGHPMGAVVCTEAIARSFETGMEFFSSFGGNPVSCEIGLAVLNVIEEEGLQENARIVGDYLIGELQRLFSLQNSTLGSDESSHHGTFPVEKPFYVSEVRGSGLFLGIELTESGTGKPATEAAGFIVNSMKERGFLLSTDGPFNNVIKFKPPMCFSMENAEEMVGALKELFNQ